MNKSTKGAVAAGAAAVLLLGGAGSLAYWQATGTLPGGTITAGTLTLTEDTAVSGWMLNGTPIADADLATTLIVPGDELEYTGAYTIGATGKNLQADLEVTTTGASGDLAAAVTLTSAFTLDGTTVTTITDDNDGDTLLATVGIDFPFGADVDNTSQGDSLDLTGVEIVATQTDATQ